MNRSQSKKRKEKLKQDLPIGIAFELRRKGGKYYYRKTGLKYL